MTTELKADAWMATALGDPTKVLERQTVAVRAPGPGEVRVKVSAFCVNFNDTDIVRGRWSVVPLQPPFIPGMEPMGVVESAGPGAEYLVGPAHRRHPGGRARRLCRVLASSMRRARC